MNDLAQKNILMKDVGCVIPYLHFAEEKFLSETSVYYFSFHCGEQL